MIMAGRGRRLVDSGDESRKVGSPQVFPEDDSVDVQSITKKINDMDLSDINPSLLNNFESMFKQIFTSKEVMKDVISNLHTKSLDDAEFGEKLIVALEQVLSLEVNGVLVRSELLSLIQNDFNTRKETYKTNLKQFLNSVMLLGHIYNKVKVSGRPIAILAPALFEYFELLLKGEEEELKTLVKQIFINGKKLSEIENYKHLVQNLRNSLINRNLNTKSKCWILLAVDITSNSFQPLAEGVKDFYEANLGEEYKKLECFIKVQNDQILLSPVSSDSVRSQDSESPKIKKFNSRKHDNFKKDLSKKFSDMSMKSGNDKPPPRNFKADNWKPSGGGGGRRSSGHDDRFEKEENFYGIQKPRGPKPENQRRKFNDDKSSKTEFGHFKTDTDEKVDSQQPQITEESNWN